MKIKYSTVIAECSEDQAMHKILEILHKRRIPYIESNTNSISFKQELWNWGSNAKAVFSADKGCFIVNTTNHSVASIDYTIHISVWFDIMIIILSGVVGTFYGPIIYLLGIGIMIQLFTRIFKIRKYHQELLELIRSSINKEYDNQ